MADFTDYATAAAALASPGTSGADLAAIAATQPSLWVRVAGHPNAYPDLLGWLETYGDATVKAAVSAARRPIAPPPPPPTPPIATAWPPSAQPTMPYQPAQHYQPAPPFQQASPVQPVALVQPLPASSPTVFGTSVEEPTAARFAVSETVASAPQDQVADESEAPTPDALSPEAPDAEMPATAESLPTDSEPMKQEVSAVIPGVGNGQAIPIAPGYGVPNQGYGVPPQGYPVQQQGYPAPLQGYAAPNPGQPPTQTQAGYPPGYGVPYQNSVQPNYSQGSQAIVQTPKKPANKMVIIIAAAVIVLGLVAGITFVNLTGNSSNISAAKSGPRVQTAEHIQNLITFFPIVTGFGLKEADFDGGVASCGAGSSLSTLAEADYKEGWLGVFANEDDVANYLKSRKSCWESNGNTISSYSEDPHREAWVVTMAQKDQVPVHFVGYRNVVLYVMSDVVWSETILEMFIGAVDIDAT